MPGTEPSQLRRPRVTTLDLYRLIDAYKQAGEEFVGRPFRLSADTLRRVTRHVERGLLGPWSSEQVVSGIVREGVNLASGLLSVLPATLEALANRISNPSPAILSEYRVPISGSEPEEVGSMVEIGDTQLVLPARIMDASQGWATWFVPRAKVVELIRRGTKRGSIDKTILAEFEPLDCGSDRSAVMLIGTDFRVSDLGRYQEVSLGAWLTQRANATKPGLFFVRKMLSAQHPVDLSRQAWGFQSDFFAGLKVDYGRHHAQFFLGQGRKGEFFLTVPRFGSGRSFEIPITIYSALESGRVRKRPYPIRVNMARSGIHEGVQIGGDVEVQLGSGPGDGDQNGRCFCQGSVIPCLCDELRNIGVDKVSAAANGWTERLVGSLGPSGPLQIQPFGNH